jgi:DNA mismatch repair protein MutL
VTIIKLDDRTIDKIAAGEVVERPASIIKELVENALDAGASFVEVELEDGGKRSIRIKDNGSGITKDDLPLAVMRHATSKIRSEDDLFSIQTMGFRGEALASIAAVSKFQISSQREEGGCRLVGSGGEFGPLQDWHGHRGTVVEVRDLFFNIPARRAFLKSSSAEFGACLELLQALALAHIACGFILVHNGKRVLECLPAKDLRSRCLQIYGSDISDRLLDVQRRGSYASVSGLISPPGLSYATSKHMFFYLNRRWLRDKTLRYGIVRGYHSHLLRSRYPLVILNIESDPSLVDVNVHPAKTEVRWQYATEVQSLVALAVREVLQSAAWAAPLGDSSFLSTASPVVEKQKSPTVSNESFASTVFNRAPPRSYHQSSSVQSSVVTAPMPVSVPKSPAPIRWTELDYIGVFRRCYLLFEGEAGLLAVDQHAFHERILYEQFLQNQSLLNQSQPLAIPELVSLNPDHHGRLLSMLEQKHPALGGFKLTPIDDRSVEVTAVPSMLKHRSIDDLLTAVASGVGVDTATLGHDVLSTLACHAAVRAGEELADDDRNLLISAASSVDFYHNCPHGRPVFRWWSAHQVASWFDR